MLEIAENLIEMQKKSRMKGGSFYILERSCNYTVITQEKFSNDIDKKFKNKIKTK